MGIVPIGLRLVYNYRSADLPVNVEFNPAVHTHTHTHTHTQIYL